MNKIIKKDCREGMRELIKQGYSKYFDFIEIDPPYNIGKDKWDKFKSHEEYLEFIKEVINLSNQLMSDNGTLFLWHNNILVLSDFIQLIKNNTDLKLKQQCIWNKYYKYNDDGTINNLYGYLNGYIQSDVNRNYRTMCEYILYYTKQENERYYNKNIRDYLRLERDKCTKLGFTDKKLRELCEVSLKGGGFLSHIWGENQWRFPTEKIYNKLQLTGEFKIPYKELKEKYDKDRYTYNSDKNNLRSCIWQYPISKETKHKTEKPLQLYYDMFEVHTRKDSKCLFPFIGSGNNIMSLLDINKNDNGSRKYIGFETDEKWYELINNRIETII